MTKTPRISTLIIASLTAAGAAHAGAHLPARSEAPEPEQLLAPASSQERSLDTPQLAPLPEVGSASSAESTSAQRQLAERMTAALLGKGERGTARKPSAKKATSTPGAAASPKRWICRDWQELWQGYGKARSCDWH